MMMMDKNVNIKTNVLWEKGNVNVSKCKKINSFLINCE